MILGYVEHLFAHLFPGLEAMVGHWTALRRGHPVRVYVDHLALHGPRLDEAFPALLWGVTPGLKVPCADGSVQRLYPPGERVPGHPVGSAIWWWVLPDWSSQQPGWEVYDFARVSVLDDTLILSGGERG